ncbi:MAG: hypothetical protein IPO65_09080 [Saprospiraceae bacterium]|nr:hypothetical protein [Saprospiraceae bacterium]
MAVSVASKTAVKKVKSASVSYHIMFWLALALIAALLSRTNQSFMIDFGLELVVISFYALIVYFNYFYLFPIM